MKELGAARAGYGFRLFGYVVMPEHVHLLMSEPVKGTVSTALQMVKQRISRKLRKSKRRSAMGQLAFGFSGEDGRPRAFWQARFYDFNVYSEGKRKEKLNYIHANPVVRRLVKHPRDWPWSSWSFYYRGEGMLSIDVV